MNGSDPKQSARELLVEAHPALVGLSHWIHANPEIGFGETLASGWVAEWLNTAGFDVEVGAAGMATAVIGSTGPGPFHVAICLEYDALPVLGHACGHNIIAAAGVGAGLALASVADELGLRVTVMGTPAEEGGGGKIRLIDAGSFSGVHAALMVHPWPSDVAEPTIIAVRTLEITYIGREAHAAGFPQLGVNAADALVIAQAAVGLLRQHLLPSDRVHGIVTKGGDAPNVIPAHTTAQFMVRAHSRERLDVLTDRVRRCFEAGAMATGAEVAISEEVTYSDMQHDSELAALYRANAESLGRVFEEGAGAPVSTDMGDVSHVVPSIHPMIGIETHGAVNHQRGFADASATPSADMAILDGATALTWTVIDAALDASLRARLMGQALVAEAVELAVEADQLGVVSDVLAAEAASLAALADSDQAEAAELDARAHELAEADGGVTDEVMLLEATALDLSDRAAMEAIEAEQLGAISGSFAEEAEARAEEAEALVDEAAELQADAAGELEADALGAGAAWSDGPAAESSDALAAEAIEMTEQAEADIAQAAALDARAHELAEADGGVTDEVVLLEATALRLGDQAVDEAAEADELQQEAAELQADAAGELEADALGAGAAWSDGPAAESSDALAAEAIEMTEQAEADIAQAAALDARAHELAEADGGVTDEVVLLEATALRLGDQAVDEAAEADELQQEAFEAADATGGYEDDWLATPTQATFASGGAPDTVAEYALFEPAPSAGGPAATEPVLEADIDVEYVGFESMADTEVTSGPAPVAEAMAEFVDFEPEPVAEAGPGFVEFEPEPVSTAAEFVVHEPEPVAEASAVAYEPEPEPVAEASAVAYEPEPEPVAEASAVAYEPEPEPVAEASAVAYEPEPEPVAEASAVAYEPEPEPVAEASAVAYEPEPEPVAEASAVAYEPEPEPVAEASAVAYEPEPEPEPEPVADASPAFASHEAEAEPEPVADASPAFASYEAEAEPEPVADASPAFASYEAEAEPEPVADASPAFASYEAEAEPEPVTEQVAESASGSDGDRWTAPAASEVEQPHEAVWSLPSAAAPDEAIAAVAVDSWQVSEPDLEPVASATGEQDVVSQAQTAPDSEADHAARLAALPSWSVVVPVAAPRAPWESPSDAAEAQSRWDAEFEAALSAPAPAPAPAVNLGTLPSEASTDVDPWALPNDSTDTPGLGDFEWIAAEPDSGGDELART